MKLDALKSGRWLYTRNHGREVVKAMKACNKNHDLKKKQWVLSTVDQILHMFSASLGCREEEIDPEDVITDQLTPLVLLESQAHSSESQSLPKEHSTG